MNWAKRGLSLILIVLMLVSCLPMAAFAAISTDYSAKVTVEKSANESYNGQDVAKVSFIANANGQKVGNGCSVLLAYDPDVFELLELSEDDGSIIGKMETSTETWSTDIGYNIMVEVLQRFTPKANACMSADGETAYLMLQPMRMGSGSIISEDTVLMAAYLGLADGVSWDAIPSNAIRMGTVEERNTLNQSAIAVLNDGDKTNYIYGFKNGNDTLAKPEVVPVGYTPVKPAYTGPRRQAPCGKFGCRRPAPPAKQIMQRQIQRNRPLSVGQGAVQIWLRQCGGFSVPAARRLPFCQCRAQGADIIGRGAAAASQDFSAAAGADSPVCGAV